MASLLLQMKPSPRGIRETRAVLAALERHGDILHFRVERHESTKLPTPAAYCVFKSEKVAEKVLNVGEFKVKGESDVISVSAMRAEGFTIRERRRLDSIPQSDEGVPQRVKDWTEDPLREFDLDIPTEEDSGTSRRQQRWNQRYISSFKGIQSIVKEAQRHGRNHQAQGVRSYSTTTKPRPRAPLCPYLSPTRTPNVQQRRGIETEPELEAVFSLVTKTPFGLAIRNFPKKKGENLSEIKPDENWSREQIVRLHREKRLERLERSEHEKEEREKRILENRKRGALQNLIEKMKREESEESLQETSTISTAPLEDEATGTIRRSSLEETGGLQEKKAGYTVTAGGRRLSHTPKIPWFNEPVTPMGYAPRNWESTGEEKAAAEKEIDATEQSSSGVIATAGNETMKNGPTDELEVATSGKPFQLSTEGIVSKRLSTRALRRIPEYAAWKVKDPKYVVKGPGGRASILYSIAEAKKLYEEPHHFVPPVQFPRQVDTSQIKRSYAGRVSYIINGRSINPMTSRPEFVDRYLSWDQILPLFFRPVSRKNSR